MSWTIMTNNITPNAKLFTIWPYKKSLPIHGIKYASELSHPRVSKVRYLFTSTHSSLAKGYPKSANSSDLLDDSVSRPEEALL